MSSSENPILDEKEPFFIVWHIYFKMAFFYFFKITYPIYKPQIKRIELHDGQVVFCLWVSRDPDDEREGGDRDLLSSLNSSSFGASLSTVGEVSN